VDWIASSSSSSNGGDNALLEMERAVSGSQQYSVDAWGSYIDALEENDDNNVDGEGSVNVSRTHVIDWTFRRALANLPRSYKLWRRYWEFLALQERTTTAEHHEGPAAQGGGAQLLPIALDRALWTCHGFPRAWITYFEFLERHPTYQSITVTRRLASRCLQSLPLTQHHKVWPAIRKSLSAIPNLPVETHARLISHHAQLDPSQKREYGEFLMRAELWGAAAAVLWQILNVSASDDNSSTAAVMDPESLWLDFVRLCAQHPRDASAIPWERILSSQLTQPPPPASSTPATSSSSSSAGLLWSLWAESYVRRGNFDRARTIYERGMQTVRTLQDFTVIYNAYLQMEEELLTVLAGQVPDDDDEDDDEQMGETAEMLTSEADEWEILLNENATSAHQAQLQLEWALARAEHLTSRRPLWLNQVLLRQNPNDVGEWLKRAKLLGGGRPSIQALEEALTVVQSTQAVNGNPSQIVSQLLQLHEKQSLDQARDLMDRVCRQTVYRFRSADDLAECWTMWIEFELRHEAWDDALSLARQAVAPGSTTSTRESRGSARPWNLTKSLRLWDLRLDLEESLGTVQTTKDAYNHVLSIKAATVQHVLNYCAFLTEHKYFEESFTVYERGLELFAFPHKGAKLLWKEYLQSFLARYKGAKVERVRDMFQRCLETCPPDECSEFFLLNAEFEEQHGLTKRALGVYRAMCDRVPKEERLTAYRLFIAKTTQFLGLTATRDIYQAALDKLDDDKSAALLCMDFVKMESSLHQIDRARAIFTYGAQLADPRRMPEYWKAWNEFEIAHGNEETFRDMLRVKRSVEAAFSTVNYNATGMSDAVETLSDAEAMRMIANQEGVDLDEQRPQTSVAGFVAGKRTAVAADLGDVEERVLKLRKAATEAFGDRATTTAEGADGDANDNDEIDIDDIDAEIEEAAAEGAAIEQTATSTNDAVHDVSTKEIPASVFGGLVPDAS
jgi:pre-mRNA-splicing factor SYF1